MLQRYVAGAAVASVFVAMAAIGLLISGALNTTPGLYRVTTAWCIL